MKILVIFLLLSLTAFPCPAQSEAEALAFVKQHHPAIHQKILTLKTTAPEDYQNALDDAIKATTDHQKILASGDAAAATAFLKMYDIDFAAIALSDQYLAAQTDPERTALKQQLQTKIAESFDQWLIVERSRVQRLEAELAKAKASVEEAARHREKVIAEDTEALLEESRTYQKSKKN